MYHESPQMTLFGDASIERVSLLQIKRYWLNRLQEIFPGVSMNALELKNEKNSTLFLLCFAVSNPSATARELSVKAANHILTHTN